MDIIWQEIQDFRRKATTRLEWWSFVLASEKRQQVWESCSPKGKKQLKKWQAILEQISRLTSPDPKICRESIAKLSHFGLTARVAIPYLLPFLNFFSNDEEIEQCILAEETLGKLKSKKAIPQLLKNSQNPNNRVRKYAIIALGDIQYSNKTIQQCLLNIMHHDSQWINRGNAAFALSGIGAIEQLSELRKTFQDKDFYVRRMAIKAINNLYPLNNEIVPKSEFLDVYQEALQDADYMVLMDAAYGLSVLKEQAKELVPLLLKNLKHELVGVPCSMLFVLEKIREIPISALPEILPFLKHYESSLQKRAVEIFIQMEPPPISEIFFIFEENEEYSLQKANIWRIFKGWLKKYPKKTQEILLPLCERLLFQKDSHFREQAIFILTKYEYFSEKIILRLQQIKKEDPVHPIRKTARTALKKAKNVKKRRSKGVAYKPKFHTDKEKK